MNSIKVEYIEHKYNSKPIERLAINAAIKEAKRNGKVNIIDLSAALRKYSKGLRSKLSYTHESGTHLIKAQGFEKDIRAKLLDYMPDWAN